MSNRSVPAALKNALDVGSRPSGSNVFNGKASAIVTLSPGALGGFGANHHLRQTLVVLNSPALAQPEMYLSGAADLLRADGTFASDAVRRLAAGFVSTFESFVALHASALEHV